MNDRDLNSRLDSYQAPTPSDLLKARILKAGQAEAAPSPAFSRRWATMAASLIAICAIGFTGWQMSGQNAETDTEIWQEAALDLGFEEIYLWVEDSETASQLEN